MNNFYNYSRIYKNQNGQLHNLDGPAYETIYGYKCFYIHGKEYSEEEFNSIKKIYTILKCLK